MLPPNVPLILDDNKISRTFIINATYINILEYYG